MRFILNIGLELFTWRIEKTAPKLRFITYIIYQKIKEVKKGRSKYKFFDEEDWGTKAIMAKYLKDYGSNARLREKLNERRLSINTKKMINYLMLKVN